jgi:hypothetical protein
MKAKLNNGNSSHSDQEHRAYNILLSRAKLKPGANMASNEDILLHSTTGFQ